MDRLAHRDFQGSARRQPGTDVRATRGRVARVRDQLKSDRDANQSANPAAQRDQFGSRHNENEIKQHQRQMGRPAKGTQNLQFRESAQDVQPDRGEKNKLPGRRTRKSGSPRKKAEKK